MTGLSAPEPAAVRGAIAPAGCLIGSRLHARAPQAQVRRAIRVLLFVNAASLLVRGMVRVWCAPVQRRARLAGGAVDPRTTSETSTS